MNIQIESPDQADVRLLIENLDAYLASLYPAESNHLLDLAALQQDNVVFVVARDDDGSAVGCGALVIKPPMAEVKRMFIRPDQRGRGTGRAILQFLERAAAQHQCLELLLETGVEQAEAIRLYERAGFERCGAFGGYVEDPLSVFMGKRCPG